MTEEIEIEYKNLITEKEYESIHKFFRAYHWKETHQKNYYFETRQFDLKKHHAALRIREKNNQFQLTLKKPNPDGDGLLEVHASLTPAEAHSWMNGIIIPKPEIESHLARIGINSKNLQYSGRLETKRLECNYQQTIVVLDTSCYNGQTDYELELEAATRLQGEQVFTSILNILQIPRRKTANKIARFYKTLSS